MRPDEGDSGGRWLRSLTILGNIVVVGLLLLGIGVLAICVAERWLP